MNVEQHLPRRLRRFHLFERGGVTYVLNVTRMKAGRLSSEAKAALDRLAADPYAPVSKAAEDELRGLTLIEPTDPALKACAEDFEEGRLEEIQRQATVPVTSVVLMISQRCNFRCTYCYGDAGEYGHAGDMDQRTARRTVDWLIGASGEDTKLHLGFFGGEPLMNFPLMREVAEYARLRADEAGRELELAITTNASLVTDEIVTWLAENDVKVLVSIDGPKEVQDRNRPLQNGRGSYDLVAPRVQKLIAALPEVNCRATLCPDTDPGRVRKALVAMGFSSVQITHMTPPVQDRDRPVASHTETAVHETVPDGSAQMSAVLAAIKGRDAERLKDLRRINSVGHTLGAVGMLPRKLYFCGVGRGMRAVSATGEIFPCHRFVGVPELCMGSVFDSGPHSQDHSQWQDCPAQDGARCGECWARHFCAGECAHNNYCVTGDPFQTPEATCESHRRNAEELVWLHCECDEDDRAWLTENELIPARPCPLDF